MKEKKKSKRGQSRSSGAQTAGRQTSLLATDIKRFVCGGSKRGELESLCRQCYYGGDPKVAGDGEREGGREGGRDGSVGYLRERDGGKEGWMGVLAI